MASNASVHADLDYGNYTDWIELYNPTDNMIDLSGYYLTDDSTNLAMWPFQSGTMIAAHEYILVYADGNGNGMHTNFRLAKEGESVLLVNPLLTIIDSIRYPYQLTDISFGRDPANHHHSAFFEKPTPGEINDTQMAAAISPVPQFSLPGGFYPEPVMLEITTPSSAAEIYFTVDGTEPSRSSTRYSDPISIGQNTVVRVKSFQDDLLTGPSVSNRISSTSHRIYR